jgi:hypothetical protein
MLTDIFHVKFAHPKDGVTEVAFAGPRQGADGRARLELEMGLAEGPVYVTYSLIAHPPGHLALVGLRLAVPLQTGLPPGNALTAETLRHVRIGDYVRFLEPILDHLRSEARSGQVARMRAAGFGFLLDGRIPMGRTRQDRDPRPRVGRPRLSDQLLARVARAYLDALQRHSDRPVLDAAARLHERPERVRDLLHRARRRGLLEGSKSGVAGGALTTGGRALLRQQTKRGKRRSQ